MLETNSSTEADGCSPATHPGIELPITQGLLNTLFDRQRPDGFMIGYNMYRQDLENIAADIRGRLKTLGDCRLELPEQ
jgi:hypothetical protein